MKTPPPLVGESLRLVGKIIEVTKAIQISLACNQIFSEIGYNAMFVLIVASQATGQKIAQIGVQSLSR